MITYSQIQNIAGDLEFAAAMITPCPDIDGHESWLLGGAEGVLMRERISIAASVKLAAEILSHLTIEQIESLPSYLRAA